MAFQSNYQTSVFSNFLLQNNIDRPDDHIFLIINRIVRFAFKAYHVIPFQSITPIKKTLQHAQTSYLPITTMNYLSCFNLLT